MAKTSKYGNCKNTKKYEKKSTMEKPPKSPKKKVEKGKKKKAVSKKYGCYVCDKIDTKWKNMRKHLKEDHNIKKPNFKKSVKHSDTIKLRESLKNSDTAHVWQHTCQHQGNDLGQGKNSEYNLFGEHSIIDVLHLEVRQIRQEHRQSAAKIPPGNKVHRLDGGGLLQGA